MLLLGAGDMGEGMAVALAGAGVAEVRVANRTRNRAETLAHRVGGRAVSLAEFPEHLAEVDLLLTSTGAQALMVEKADLVPVMAERPDRPLLIVDIAVPRDVDVTVGEIPGVTRLDMDDLRAFADAGLAERRREVAGVEAILNDELERYLGATSAREVAPMIVALRRQAEGLRAGRAGPPAAPHGRARRPPGRADRGRDPQRRGQAPAPAHGRPQGRRRQPAGDRLVAALRELFEIES